MFSCPTESSTAKIGKADCALFHGGPEMAFSPRAVVFLHVLRRWPNSAHDYQLFSFLPWPYAICRVSKALQFCTLVPPTGLSLPAGDKAVFVRKAWSRPELSCTAAEGSLGTGSPSGKQMSELHSACEVQLIMGKTSEKNLVRTIAGCITVFLGCFFLLFP
jgi:hypothetical protein